MEASEPEGGVGAQVASLEEADEGQLLAALRTGQREAAELLAQRTYRAVWAALFRLTGNADLAADLTQETYRRTWGGLAGFDGRARFSTWLYRIAYNTFLNQIRGPQRVVAFEEGHLAVRDPRPAPDEAVERRATARRVRRAVLQLPEVLRYTVTARYWAELPVREIARQEGVTTVAIRKRLKRAAEILAPALEEVNHEGT